MRRPLGRVDDLVPVRTWLGQLAPADRWPEFGPAQGRGRPPHAPLPADRFYEDRSDGAQRHATRRCLLVAATAAAAVFLGVLVITGPSDHSFRAADSATGVSGHPELHGTPAGTQIVLTAAGLPGGKRCILVAVSSGGTDMAGTWDATYDGTARIAGTSAFPASRLTALRVESDTDVLLLGIRVRP